jgi:hypothetical protein
MWTSRTGQCLAGKKDRGQRANRKEGGPAGGLAPKPCCSAGAPDGQNAGHRLQYMVKLTGAAFSFLAARPLVAELGRAARLLAPFERGCSLSSP